MIKEQNIVEEEVKEHIVKVDTVGIIAEILNNLVDIREGVRELLSNAAAREVGATQVKVGVFEDPALGLSFYVEDDGCGMDYTGDGAGRLGRFLNIAQGRQSGHPSDEFGEKGLGTILLYNSRHVEVQTWDGKSEYYYNVIMNDPRGNILDEQKLLEPKLHKIPVKEDRFVKKGTKITVGGWDNKRKFTSEFKMEALERYLSHHTVVGFTLPRDSNYPLPKFILGRGGEYPKEIKPGFPYLWENKNVETLKTVIFHDIKKTKKTQDGKNVEITLKGGVSIESGKFNLSSTGGVWLSVRGIPYFNLDTNKYAKRLGLKDDFVKFVVNCNDVRLNMGRNDFCYDDRYDAFEEALNDAFDDIKNDTTFQKFYRNYHKVNLIELQEYMSQKKKEFLSPEKKFVWYKGRQLLSIPESEYDTAALLWKLEGLGFLPFKVFQTLQYPGYQKGIDLLVDMQEDAESQLKLCEYAEIERLFSRFLRHKHDARQTSIIICWKMDGVKGQPGKIEKTSMQYKYYYNISDTRVPIFEISSFPNIFVGTKEEAEEKEKTSKQ